MDRISFEPHRFKSSTNHTLAIDNTLPPSDVEWWYDKRTNALWLLMDLKPRQCYTYPVLKKMNEIETLLTKNFSGYVLDENNEYFPVWHYVIASKTPGVFNYGGDLAFFKECIATKAISDLLEYGRLCVDGLYNRHLLGIGQKQIITWAYVDGDAFGGGFETALGLDFIAATEKSRFGCPESRFGFYPGMGAYSFLSRKTSDAFAAEVILSGETYTASKAYDHGAVDYLLYNSSDMESFTQLLTAINKNIVTFRGLINARRAANKVTHYELVDVVQHWARSAMDLSDRDLRLMEKIVKQQLRKNGEENG